MTVVFNDEFEKKPRKEVAEAVDDFEWTFDKRGATLTGVAVRDFREARIPAKVDGRPVVAIGAEAFDWKEGLETVVFPATLETLGDGAFSGCKALAEVEFLANSKLTTIEKNAFEECVALRAFDLPRGTKKIGERAFADCYTLKSIALPEGTTTVGDGAFSGCASLEALKIPASLRSFGDDAFVGCASLWAVVLPEISKKRLVSSIAGNCRRAS